MFSTGLLVPCLRVLGESATPSDPLLDAEYFPKGNINVSTFWRTID